MKKTDLMLIVDKLCCNRLDYEIEELETEEPIKGAFRLKLKYFSEGLQKRYGVATRLDTDYDDRIGSRHTKMLVKAAVGAVKRHLIKNMSMELKSLGHEPEGLFVNHYDNTFIQDMEKDGIDPFRSVGSNSFYYKKYGQSSVFKKLWQLPSFKQVEILYMEALNG